jgi:hypothetical protein
MMDLHDRLDRIAGPAAEPTPAQADADLARGRRALNRRRAVQKLGVAAVALAGAVAWGTQAGPAPSDPAPPPARVASAKLVAYRGEQPQGFTIDKVPAGWEVQGGGLANLTIAPKGIADRHPDSFVGKIAIMLQSADDTSTPDGTRITVGGRPGVLQPVGAGGVEHGRTLWVQQPDGVWMLVQIWDSRGWTEQDIAEFADGIHVEPGAQRGHG